MMQKHFLPILFITFLISFFSLSSCTYENMPIPDIEQYTIDTVMTQPIHQDIFMEGFMKINQSKDEFLKHIRQHLT
ncbi:MAG: hypothetical protein H6552_02460 [Chitinophagales bacterium]|nr:hypothetical protein [Chitinophagales bacterium]